MELMANTGMMYVGVGLGQAAGDADLIHGVGELCVVAVLSVGCLGLEAFPDKLGPEEAGIQEVEGRDHHRDRESDPEQGGEAVGQGERGIRDKEAQAQQNHPRDKGDGRKVEDDED
jgi:hypothetical protein